MRRKKLTQEEFISKSKILNSENFDYSLVDYIDLYTKVKIRCKKCGDILQQTPYYHLDGRNCKKCFNQNQKITIEEFIRRSKIKHDDKFDYSLVEYINMRTKIKILCKKCNKVFEQTPLGHLAGGCLNCDNEQRKMTLEEFIKRSRIKHGDKYDYSLINYINIYTKVKILCKKCNNVFEQRPDVHLNGSGCLICSGCKKSTTEQFVEKSKLFHGYKYDYSLVNYNNNITKVNIICPEHGIFEIIPSSHLSGCGCPKCNQSKGEIKVEKFLRENNIKYFIQYKFKGCRYKNPLSFDFYLSELNTCIEYDGEQHFHSRCYFDDDNLETRKIRDEIKNEYCRKNNINLLRIKYTENVENKLKKYLIYTKN